MKLSSEEISKMIEDCYPENQKEDKFLEWIESIEHKVSWIFISKVKEKYLQIINNNHDTQQR